MPLLTALVTKKNPSAPQLPVPVAPPTDLSLMSDPQRWVEENPGKSALIGTGMAVAAGISYQRNHSVPWAVASALGYIPYLAYVGYETLAKRGSLDFLGIEGSRDDAFDAAAADELFLQGVGLDAV